MAIKVDLEKAFDKLSWSFIQDTLEDLGLPSRIISLIMHCISTPSMQILWKGRPTESFCPSRGIRQGDPLSPYIFILCMERLSQAITKEVRNGNWEAIKLGHRGSPISHLFFADDLFLFSGTSQNQLALIKRMLDDFCDASGQVISQSKTRMFFSKNITKREADRIGETLPFQRSHNLGNYLGVPLLHDRVTKDTYGYLIDKVQRRLASWKASSLSLAGRMTLAKSMLNSVPYYTMQSTSLLQSCIKTIEKLTRRFLWGNNDTSRKVSLIRWEEVCQPLSRGGCGLKRLEGQNKAFLAKLAFQLVSRPDQLWVQVLRAKYNWSNKSNYTFRTRSSSHLWRSIAKIWPETEIHLHWKPGNGSCIRFWSDS